MRTCTLCLALAMTTPAWADEPVASDAPMAEDDTLAAREDVEPEGEGDVAPLQAAHATEEPVYLLDPTTVTDPVTGCDGGFEQTTPRRLPIVPEAASRWYAGADWRADGARDLGHAARWIDLAPADFGYAAIKAPNPAVVVASYQAIVHRVPSPPLPPYVDAPDRTWPDCTAMDGVVHCFGMH